MGTCVAVPFEAIAALRRRLTVLPPRHPERLLLMDSTAGLYDVSRATLYRLLHGERRPKDAHRVDRGKPRIMTAAEVCALAGLGRRIFFAHLAKQRETMQAR